MDDSRQPHPRPDLRVCLVLVLITLLTVVLSGFSSALPDGLEASAGEIGLVASSPLGGISLPDLIRVDWLAALIGVALTGGLLWILAAKISKKGSGAGPL